MLDYDVEVLEYSSQLLSVLILQVVKIDLLAESNAYLMSLHGIGIIWILRSICYKKIIRNYCFLFVEKIKSR